jgi:hypothetical protein
MSEAGHPQSSPGDDSFTTTVDLVIDAIATHSTTQETRTPK